MDAHEKKKKEKQKKDIFYWSRGNNLSENDKLSCSKMCINLSEIHISYSFSYMRI